MFSDFSRGTAFGAALTAAGIVEPTAILSQMKLENYSMMQTFLTATATSTALVPILKRTSHLEVSPRSFSTIGLFSFFDGNLLGDTLLGVGMALAASCPGTVLAQVGVGYQSGYWALGGAVLGGILWVGLLKPLIPNNVNPVRPLAIHEVCGISRGTTVAALETVFATSIGAMAWFSPSKDVAGLSPITGGLVIGLSQLFSILVQHTLIGASGFYDEIGSYICGLPSCARKDSWRLKSCNSIIFGCGAMAGAWALSFAFPALRLQVVEGATAVPCKQAFLGGLLMSVGARMAGGCTSGHGISGISLLSVSSLITIASAMGVGMLVATTYL